MAEQHVTTTAPTLTLDEYQRLARRTSNPNQPTTIRLAVAALGLGGEAGEVMKLFFDKRSDAERKEEIMKELGDLLWYVAETASTLQFTLSACLIVPMDTAFNDLGNYYIPNLMPDENILVQVSEFQDYVKKHVGHGHELDLELVMNSVDKFIGNILKICDYHNIDINEVAKMNIEKLKKRYPEGFSSERSINREE